jgi:hypothetical protein
MKQNNRRIKVLIAFLFFVILAGSVHLGLMTFSAHMHNKRAQSYADGNWVLAENLFAIGLKNNKIRFFGLHEMVLPASADNSNIVYNRIEIKDGRSLDGVNHFLSVSDFILTQYACYLAIVGDKAVSRSLVMSLKGKPTDGWHPHVDLQSWCLAYLDGDLRYQTDVESAARQSLERMKKYAIPTCERGQISLIAN